MSPGFFLLLCLALAFYNVGTIWSHEIDTFRSSRLPDGASDFGRVESAQQRKLPYRVLVPVGLALMGSLVLVFYRPDNAPSWPVWCAIGCQLTSHVLAALCWGRRKAKPREDAAGRRSPRLATISATHWIRTLLITVYALVLLGWAADAMAMRPIRGLHAFQNETVQADIVTMEAGSATPPTFALAGRVEGASGGHVLFVALWRADGFLRRPADAVRIEPGKPAAFRFKVARGSWALSAFEDVNDDGELDMGVFGPKEPSGFWRTFTGWHRPKFEEVSSVVERDIDNANIELE